MLMEQIRFYFFGTESESWDTFRLNPILGTLFWRLVGVIVFLGGGTEIDEHKMCDFGVARSYICVVFVAPKPLFWRMLRMQKKMRHVLQTANHLFLPSSQPPKNLSETPKTTIFAQCCQ